MNSIALNAVIVLQNFADLLKSGGTLTFLVFDKKKVHILHFILVHHTELIGDKLFRFHIDHVDLLDLVAFLEDSLKASHFRQQVLSEHQIILFLFGGEVVEEVDFDLLLHN